MTEYLIPLLLLTFLAGLVIGYEVGRKFERLMAKRPWSGIERRRPSGQKEVS